MVREVIDGFSATLRDAFKDTMDCVDSLMALGRKDPEEIIPTVDTEDSIADQYCMDDPKWSPYSLSWFRPVRSTSPQ